MRWMGVFVFLTLCLASAPGLAEPVKLTDPLDKIETTRGPVEVRTEGLAVVMTLDRPGVAQDRLFRVEVDSAVGLPSALRFHEPAAEVLLWRGHLFLVAPGQGKAWHFSIADTDAAARTRPGSPDPALLEATLAGDYELSRLGASAIISRGGPQAFRPEAGGALRSSPLKIDYQDPESSGIGSCGTSCTMKCGDGSSCNVTCSAKRCAACSCPASCTCS